MRRYKLDNIIIFALSTILITSSMLLYKKYYQIRNKSTKELTINENIKLIDASLLIKKLNNVNKMIVLTGDIAINATYTNEDIIDDDVNFLWVREFLEGLSSKDLYVDAIYNFSYIYDLEDMDIEIINDIPTIHINKNRLSVTVELNENQTFYTDRVGFLESEFTPNEINSLNARTKDLVYNRTTNDLSMRNQSFEQLKANIDELLGIKCSYTISDYDVLETTNEIKIIN